MGYIYIVTNDVNDKVYIGQTVTTLQNRWNQHISKSKKSNSYFYRAIRDIGIEHFKINLLEQCASEKLNERERYYIAKYNSYHNGYNSTLGGFGGHKYELDEDAIIEMYKSFGLSYIADKYKCSVSVIRSILVKNKVELRNANNENKGVAMLLNNNIINIFSSTKQAWKWLINNYRDTTKSSEAYTYIKKACLYGNTAFGYKWMYISDIDINDFQSVLDNIEIQKLNNKNNEEKKEVSLSKRNTYKNDMNNRKNSGRPSIKCSININNNIYNFESIKELARYISIIENNEIKDDKQLRYKAYNIKKALDEGRKYKGLDIRIVSDDTSDNINRCIDCGKTLSNNRIKRCFECNRLIQNINNELKMKPNTLICKQCSRLVAHLNASGLCSSCYNVLAKGKSPKPSRDELKALLDQGIQKKQIAELYGRTDSTIHYWINSYGLR